MKRIAMFAILAVLAACGVAAAAQATAITTTGEDGHTVLVGICHQNQVNKTVFSPVWVESNLVVPWLLTFKSDFIIEPNVGKVCPSIVTTPPPVTHPAAAVKPNTDAVALCGQRPDDTIVRMWGVPTKEWLAGKWMPQGSGGLVIDVSKWQMADYGPSGLFCRDSFNAVGLTDTKTKIDGTGKTNFSVPNEGNIYELYTKTATSS